MRAAVVYESSYGNTREIAEAVAAVLDADVRSVDDAPPDLTSLDLLVVGAPTHVHGMSTATSRRSAREQSAVATEAGIGVRGWLEQMPSAPSLKAAAFDTRVDKPAVLTGSAARGIVKRLRRRGCDVVTAPESFLVSGTTGPLAPDELERAAAWGRSLRRPS